MSFFPKRDTPKEIPKEVPKEKQGEPTFFGDKKEISRRDFRRRLEKASSRIPGTPRGYNRRSRVGLEKGFGKEYGSFISRQEVKHRFRKLKRDKLRAKTTVEKKKIGDEIEYLKEKTGIK